VLFEQIVAFGVDQESLAYEASLVLLTVYAQCEVQKRQSMQLATALHELQDPILNV
jgi:hypothetical protein